MIVYDGTAPGVETFVLGPGNPTTVAAPAPVILPCWRCCQLACRCTVPAPALLPR